MHLDRLTLMAGTAAVAGTGFFLQGFGNLRKRRLMADTPTAKIRSMAMGLVEINGTVEPRSLITAPFTGHRCVYWQVEVAVRGRRDAWKTVHRNSSGNPFFLRDDTGVAMVYPAGAECRLSLGVEETCLGLTLPEPYAGYLATQRPAFRHLWRLTAMRFRERTLREGQFVYVLGTATPRPATHVVSDGEEILATGTDEDRWAARVRHRSGEVCALVRQGDNEKVFIISQTTERELTMLLGLKAWAQLAGGPLLALGGLAYLLGALR